MYVWQYPGLERAKLSAGGGEKFAHRLAIPADAFVVQASIAAVLALITGADPDLWGHLRFGLDVLRDGVLSAADPYSFTQSRPVLDHEWGGEVVMALAYRTAGMAGLVALKGALIIATLAIVSTSLHGVSARARAWLIALIGQSALPIATTLRPQLWSWLSLAVVLALLPHRRARWLVPVVFAAWANLHGGWIVGVGALGVWVWDTRTRAAWALLVASTLATLATPYGLSLWWFIAQTVRLHRDITEWQPLFTGPIVTWLPWMVACALIAVGALQRRVSPWYVAGCIALAYASARVRRLVPFFVLATVVWTFAEARVPRRATGAWVPALAAAAVLAVALVLPGSTTACWQAHGDWTPDLGVDLRARGTMLVPFAWGEYAIWRWGPALRVSVDGRRETVYTDAVVQPQLALQRNDRSALPWLSAARPDIVWYPRTSTLVRDTLVRQGYRVLAQTARSYVLARPGVPAAAWTRTEPKCFPAD